MIGQKQTSCRNQNFLSLDEHKFASLGVLVTTLLNNNVKHRIYLSRFFNTIYFGGLESAESLRVHLFWFGLRKKESVLTTA